MRAILICPRGNRLPALLACILFASFVIFSLLEFWRPYSRYRQLQRRAIFSSASVHPRSHTQPAYHDRKSTLNGEGDRYWTQVKQLLKPTDKIATVVDWNVWQPHAASIPYVYLGTANYSTLNRVPCISGYSTVAPLDQLFLKTPPHFWFSAYDVTQVQAILNEESDLKLNVVDHAMPSRISLRSQGHPPIDLTPYLPPGFSALARILPTCLTFIAS